MKRSLFKTAIAASLGLGLICTLATEPRGTVEGAGYRPQHEASAAFLVQNADVLTAKKSVLEAGGQVTHELSIINAVGARLTLTQLAALRDVPGTRVYEDRAVWSASTSTMETPATGADTGDEADGNAGDSEGTDAPAEESAGASDDSATSTTDNTADRRHRDRRHHDRRHHDRRHPRPTMAVTMSQTDAAPTPTEVPDVPHEEADEGDGDIITAAQATAVVRKYRVDVPRQRRRRPLRRARGGRV